MVFRSFTNKEWDLIAKSWKNPFTMISSLTCTPTLDIASCKPPIHTRSHDANLGRTAHSVSIHPQYIDPATNETVDGYITFGSDAPPGLRGCESELNKLKFIRLFNPTQKSGIGKATKDAFTSNGDKTEVDGNVTLYADNLPNLVQAWIRDGILPGDILKGKDLKADVSNWEMKIPVLHDKSSNRLYFLFYKEGCGGQWKGTEGNFAYFLINRLNERNSFLNSLHSKHQGNTGEQVMEYDVPDDFDVSEIPGLLPRSIVATSTHSTTTVPFSSATNDVDADDELSDSDDDDDDDDDLELQAARHEAEGQRQRSLYNGMSEYEYHRDMRIQRNDDILNGLGLRSFPKKKKRKRRKRKNKGETIPSRMQPVRKTKTSSRPSSTPSLIPVLLSPSVEGASTHSNSTQLESSSPLLPSPTPEIPLLVSPLVVAASTHSNSTQLESSSPLLPTPSPTPVIPVYNNHYSQHSSRGDGGSNYHHRFPQSQLPPSHHSGNLYQHGPYSPYSPYSPYGFQQNAYIAPQPMHFPVLPDAPPPRTTNGPPGSWDTTGSISFSHSFDVASSSSSMERNPNFNSQNAGASTSPYQRNDYNYYSFPTGIPSPQAELALGRLHVDQQSAQILNNADHVRDLGRQRSRRFRAKQRDQANSNNVRNNGLSTLAEMQTNLSNTTTTLGGQVAEIVGGRSPDEQDED